MRFCHFSSVKPLSLAAFIVLAGGSLSVNADLAAGTKAFKAGDFPTALRELTPLADQGDIDAQYNLALMYANGQGVARDGAKAAELFDKATARLDAGAQFNIGVMYYQGQGLPQDFYAAADWFRRAGERGDSEAQFNLGLMYAKGQGMPQNQREAARWFIKAAGQDITAAQNNLGDMYMEGVGVNRNYEKAFLYYNLAATQGDEDSKKDRDRVMQLMTKEQLDAAQKRALDWKPEEESLE